MFDVQWYGSVWYGLLIQLNETVMALVFVGGSWPLRGQARSHRGFVLMRRPNVGAGLPANTIDHTTQNYRIHSGSSYA
jgi:hypothetical protein